MRAKKLCSRGTGTPSARQQRSHHEEPAALSESKPISITLDAAMNSSIRRHSTQFGSTRIPYTADPHADYCTQERPSHFIFLESRISPSFAGTEFSEVGTETIFFCPNGRVEAGIAQLR